MTDEPEAMDNLIAQDADLIDAQPTQSDALLEGDTQTILYLLGVRHGREDERAKIAAEASQPTQSDALTIAREALHFAGQAFRVYVENVDTAKATATATKSEQSYAMTFTILGKKCADALAALAALQEQSK